MDPSTTGWPWTAVSNDGWITITSSPSGIGNDSVGYSFAIDHVVLRVAPLLTDGFESGDTVAWSVPVPPSHLP